MKIMHARIESKREEGRGVIVFAGIWLIALAVSGCGLVDSIRGLTDVAESSTDQVVGVLDSAIGTLAGSSADWQVVLQDAMDQLTDEAQSTIRNEISNVLNRGIAAVSLNVRCDVDFLRLRVRQDLMRIRARLLGGEVTIQPVFCDIVPAAVDMSLEPDRRNLLEFFGSDFDAEPSMQVFLVNSGQLVDVSSQLDRPSHYHMTLNLGSSGVALGPASQRLIVRWQDADISTIGILQPFIPACRESVQRIAPDPITLIPPLVRGDAEYSGNGPEIFVRLVLTQMADRIDATITMRAEETESDWTTADGTITRTIFQPPSGWAIQALVGETESADGYVDDDHAEETLFPAGPAHRFVITGDGEDDDVGRHTKVDVFFEDLQVELVEVADCVPPRALRLLDVQGLLSTSARARFSELLTPVIVPGDILPQVAPSP
ncbi:MAG: hypothetical protein A2Z66_01130 [Chloroflexi bacterium RBG_13_66_10]|nr:MAG: hypothetical protein A2Z66_01130 [Chloroflexi bacterium RBG_13_66_10]